MASTRWHFHACSNAPLKSVFFRVEVRCDCTNSVGSSGEQATATVNMLERTSAMIACVIPLNATGERHKLRTAGLTLLIVLASDTEAGISR